MINLTRTLKQNQDNYTVIQKALDKGGKIVFPEGRFPVHQTLLVHMHGTTLIGEGGCSAANTPSTMLIAKNNIEALMQISAEECHFSDMVFYGNGLDPISGTQQTAEGKTGLLFQHASETLLIRCSINAFSSHGIVFDNNKKIVDSGKIKKPGSGINDLVKIYACTIQSNGGCGVYFEYDNPDNNSIDFMGLNCRWNKSHGLHIRGLCNKVIGGHIAYNGGYGILLSDEGETKLTAGTVIMQPWFEDNGIKDRNGNTVSIRSTGSSQKSHIFSKDDFPRVDLGPNSGDYLVVPSNEPLMQILGRNAAIQIGAKNNAILGAIPRYGDNLNNKIDLWINSYDGKDTNNKKIKSNIVFQPYGGGNVVVGRRSVDPKLDNEEISIQTAGDIATESVILKGKPNNNYWRVSIDDSDPSIPNLKVEKIN